MPCVKPTVVNGPHNRLAALRQVIEQDTIIQEIAMNVVYILKSATTRLYDTEAKIICIVSKKGAQCIECHHKDI